MKLIPRAPRSRSRSKTGFALVVTLTLLILLVMLATGLLTLSTISLRSSSQSEAQHKARTNARLAVMMAVAELQKTSGDDRRITADASILAAGGEPNRVGVWESWSADFRNNPSQSLSASVYDTEKNDRFLRWLVSHPEPTTLETLESASQAATGDSIEAFTQDKDGFVLSATKVPVPTGAFAWAVSQEATRAKITVAGASTNNTDPNDAIQAQPRPNLTFSDQFQHPTGDWNARSARVISLSQADLDTELSGGSASASTARPNYTVHSMGLLTNAVEGGLKTDLSLGFELSDNDFDATQWGDFKNPFNSASAELPPAVTTGYKGQRPLYRPLNTTGTHTVRMEESNFSTAVVRFDFPAAAPTFHTLRSFYRTPYHLYNTNEGGLTVFERGADHVAFKRSPEGGLFPTPWASLPGQETQTSYRPIVDRVMFLLSAGLAPNREPRLVFTPFVTMWNPYNVSLEIEGAVAYPWIDVPFGIDWHVYKGGAQVRTHSSGLSGMMGGQLVGNNHGRSVDPYFYAAITANGRQIPNSGSVPTILFKPGEVRVFAPANPEPQPFVRPNYSGNNRRAMPIRPITVWMRPVDTISQFSTKGGLSVPLNAGAATTPMAPDESAEVAFHAVTGEDYPFFISVEDATRAKGNSATTATRGQALADVLQRYFARSGAVVAMRSGRLTVTDMMSEPGPFGVLEFYHRVAKTGTTEQTADLVYTANPRQPWMTNLMVTGTTFSSAPQYQIRMRRVSTFSDLLQTEPGSGGRTAYYGANNRIDGGRSALSFFEVPRAPMLSLAGFQHADLSSTPFTSANQFANSWASAYVPRTKTALPQSGTGFNAKPPEYDHAYLNNEALWDGFFFSGAAPTISHGQATGSSDNWENPIASTSRSLERVITDFVGEPLERPLRNPRMRLLKGTLSNEELVEQLLSPEGCVKIAAHLMVDGAFNVNSTSVEAWTAVLGGLRGEDFEVTDGTAPGSSTTAFPRFRNPIGTENDLWHGFRSLSDAQVETLAENVVEEVRSRGPFLSLADFVNRRVTSAAATGLKGPLQAAIDATPLNEAALFDPFSLSSYPAQSRQNISPNRTGVGIPGYLTQADVLQSIAPVLTVRSDTFTVRGYGEARDNAGRVIATAWCEAIVQRTPDYVDPTDSPYAAVEDLSEVNQTFGRRYAFVSFRYLSPSELRI